MDTKLFERIKKINQEINCAAIKARRKTSDIKLIAVTKTVSIEQIQNALNSGLHVFGENRVQEAKDKILKIKNPSIEWHLIGHLQSNKAKLAVELFDVIHSVDSLELAKVLNRYAETNGKVQKVLLQVKLSEETTKHGIKKENIFTLLDLISNMKNLKTLGLMTISPYFENQDMARPYFRELKNIRDTAVGEGFKLQELSMGMTNDFEAAIQEGSTMVRIGTGLFGERK
ncbi:MAG: YggS family pyridoxal phosphate-dependent enzyme [Nitrospiraceae bacterium]|nr:YggS family pyridoxal phosphate-dependent enzyme [Nitrospiraceae bacterium]